ncbi:MAG: HAMP domain-containing histidine kinase, partial [Candidatus Omnitrophica bacterium]|nr:HAMP domain-containing histidine kinase [Candidatus Omnitrophota bacterium]
MSISIQRIALIVLILVFFGLIFSVYSQYQIARENLNANLGDSLTLEGEELAEWISQSLYSSFMFSAWRDSPDPELFDLTASRWILVDQAGDLIVDTSGVAFYEFPDGAYDQIVAAEPLPPKQLQSVVTLNETVVGPLFQEEGKFIKRVYVPVPIPTEVFGENWVLVGQAGEGYFSDLFEQQKNFWWIVAALTFASTIFILLLFRGISRTERLERNLRDAEERIQLESLTSTLAHELRNPLSIIQSTAEIIRRDENLSEDGRDLVKDIIEEVQRSQDVLSHHLHPERRSPEEIDDLRSFVEDYWKRRAALVETRRLNVDVKYPEGDGRVGVRATPDQLEQILDNLLRNSSEAMPKGGSIQFELRNTPEEALLIFTDNGPGLGGFG